MKIINSTESIRREKRKQFTNQFKTLIKVNIHGVDCLFNTRNKM